jgi:hypothetical protein
MRGMQKPVSTNGHEPPGGTYTTAMTVSGASLPNPGCVFDSKLVCVIINDYLHVGDKQRPHTPDTLPLHPFLAGLFIGWRQFLATCIQLLREGGRPLLALVAGGWRG